MRRPSSSRDCAWLVICWSKPAEAAGAGAVRLAGLVCAATAARLATKAAADAAQTIITLRFMIYFLPVRTQSARAPHEKRFREDRDEPNPDVLALRRRR